MDAGARIEGVDELVRALREISRNAEKETAHVSEVVTEDEVLRTAQQIAPVGQTHRLAGATRVILRGDQVVLRNTTPYAAAVHFGRKTSYRAGGPSFPSVTRPQPFVTDAVQQRTPDLLRHMLQELADWLARSLPPS